jgi:hypothetical protein
MQEVPIGKLKIIRFAGKWVTKSAANAEKEKI